MGPDHYVVSIHKAANECVRNGGGIQAGRQDQVRLSKGSGVVPAKEVDRGLQVLMDCDSEVRRKVVLRVCFSKSCRRIYGLVISDRANRYGNYQILLS